MKCEKCKGPRSLASDRLCQNCRNMCVDYSSIDVGDIVEAVSVVADIISDFGSGGSSNSDSGGSFEGGGGSSGGGGSDGDW